MRSFRILLPQAYRGVAPTAFCVSGSNNCAPNILFNHDKPSFDNSNTHRAVTWAIERKDCLIGPKIACDAIDGSDRNFYENHACDTMRNFTRYCNQELWIRFDNQSQETDFEAYRKPV